MSRSTVSIMASLPALTEYNGQYINLKESERLTMNKKAAPTSHNKKEIIHETHSLSLNTYNNTLRTPSSIQTLSSLPFY